MTAPTTPFEDNGYTEYTSLADETTFLQQIAAGTSATYSVAGHSVQNNPINRLDIGNPVRGTHVVVTGQHGNEMPPREAVLIWARDMAYSTDPGVTAYLAQHRVVVLSTCNPDYMGVRRANHNGIDLNRDHLALSQPESQAIARVIHSTGAHIVSDHHGRQDLSGPIPWEGTYGKPAAQHHGMRSAGKSLVAAVGAGLDTAGHVGWREYRPTDDARLMLSNSAGYHHALGFLSEAWQGTPEYRVAVAYQVLESIRTWHAGNSFTLAAARAKSIEASVSNQWAYPLHGGTHIATETVDWIDPPPAGYTLAGGLSTVAQECFGVQASGGVVSMEQPAGLVIPALFDPAGEDAREPATRIAGTGPPVGPEPAPEDAPRVPTVRTPVEVRVGVNGRSAPVVEAYARESGTTRRLALPGT